MGRLERVVLPIVERGTAGALALTVGLVSFGSSLAPSLRSIGGPGRWVALALLWLFAAALGHLHRHGAPGPALRRVLWPAAALIVLAFVSSGYSVLPRLTLERSATLLVAISAAALVGYAAEVERRLVPLLLGSIVAATALICVGGLALYAFSRHDALQAAGPYTPWRWRGVGENPNTISMLSAVALAPAVWLAGRGRLETAAWSAAGAACFLTILASGSRGALLGAFVGVLLTQVLDPRPVVARIAAVAAVLVVFAVGVVATDQLAKPSSHARPPVGQGHALTSTSDSGRLAAWLRALHIGDGRPVLGYGFGTEEHVFVNRLKVFRGSHPENSFLGIYLQLGALGVALLAASLLALLAANLAAVRRRLASATPCIGLLAAGLAIAMVQSYLYSVGNVAMVSLWIGAMLGAGSLAWRPA